MTPMPSALDYSAPGPTLVPSAASGGYSVTGAVRAWTVPFQGDRPDGRTFSEDSAEDSASWPDLFRHIKCRQSREEAIAEMVALAWKWFVRLTNRGKDVSRFPCHLLPVRGFAVKSGRRLCGQEKPKDVLSPVAQKLKGFRVESLPVSSRTSHENLYAIVHGQREMDVFEERLQDNTMTPVRRASGISGSTFPSG